MNRYLAVWDMLGLEYLCNISAIEKKNLFELLKGEKPSSYPNINAIMLRAKFNEQRFYEIYLFESEIEEEELRECFEHSPQVIVNAIREVGHKLYGDGMRRTKPVIV